MKNARMKLEWDLINALAEYKKHKEAPPINKKNRPGVNKKVLHSLKRERAAKTTELYAYVSQTRAAFRSWLMENEPETVCHCGKDFKTHRSRHMPTLQVCYTCLLQEQEFQEELILNAESSLPENTLSSA